MHKIIQTQLGGKFSRDDLGLFDLKQRLVSAGIKVAYPEGDGIVATKNGVDLSFDPDKSEKSFYDIELDYFKMIKRNDVHIVHNKFKSKLGYVGDGASIEIAYALAHNKPIILLYELNLSDHVSDQMRKIVVQRSKSIVVRRLDLLDPPELRKFVESVVLQEVHHGVSLMEEREIMCSAVNLVDSYKAK